MPQIGPMEILVVLTIALLVFGPDKLPGILRNIGRAANELRQMASGVKEEFEAGMEDVDEKPSTPSDEHVEPGADSEESSPAVGALGADGGEPDARPAPEPRPEA